MGTSSRPCVRSSVRRPAALGRHRGLGTSRRANAGGARPGSVRHDSGEVALSLDAALRPVGKGNPRRPSAGGDGDEHALPQLVHLGARYRADQMPPLVLSRSGIPIHMQRVSGPRPHPMACSVLAELELGAPIRVNGEDLRKLHRCRHIDGQRRQDLRIRFSGHPGPRADNGCVIGRAIAAAPKQDQAQNDHQDLPAHARMLRERWGMGAVPFRARCGPATRLVVCSPCASAPATLGA